MGRPAGAIPNGGGNQPRLRALQHGQGWDLPCIHANPITVPCKWYNMSALLRSERHTCRRWRSTRLTQHLRMQVNISVAIIPMAQDFGWSPTVSGLVQSSFFWGYALSQIPGRVPELQHRRPPGAADRRRPVVRRHRRRAPRRRVHPRCHEADTCWTVVADLDTLLLPFAECEVAPRTEIRAGAVKLVLHKLVSH